MKNIFLTVIATFILIGSTFGQTPLKTISADEIIKQIEKGEKISYENVTVTGDFDLSKLSNRTNDATYPESGKTARVYTANIKQPISFKNIVFTGNVDFFRKDENAKEIKEYRVAFAGAVAFESCTFNQTIDFELTNFDGDVSFRNSVFKAQPSFIRVGLQKKPDFTETVFENGSIFKNFQSDKTQNLTAEQLSSFYNDYLTAK